MVLATRPYVIIVGAGPSGLLLGLLLALQGVPIRLLDMGDGLDKQPRATHYAPPAVYELRRAGVLEEIRKQGFVPRTVAWRKLDGTFIAGLDGSVLDDDPDRMVCLPLDKLGSVLYQAIQAQPTAIVSWKHKVVSLDQDDDKAWVNVESPQGPQRLEADYIVGCDGANSQIRRSLFGDWEFPGKTWDEQIVATNVRSLRTTWRGLSIIISADRELTYTHLPRRTTTLLNMDTKTLISLSILSTGIWLLVFPTTVFGALRMVRFQACRMTNCWRASLPNSRPCCLATQIQMATSLQTSVPTKFTNASQKACMSAAFCWQRMLLIVRASHPFAMLSTPSKKFRKNSM
jgi:2-polyprenyl-6-methoxyphenol hydroxylase-like FAD-dependent oxidoreductase